MTAQTKQHLTKGQRRALFIIARGDAFGGSSLHVMDMAKRLENDGSKVRILVGGQPDMEVPRRFAAKKLDFVCIPELGREIHPINDAKAAFAIRRETRKFCPDLVSLHSSKAGAVGRLGLVGMRVPILYTPHCWSFVDGFPNAKLFRLLEKALAPLASRIITVCEDERQFGLKRGVGREERVLTIHNGVTDPFQNDSPPSKPQRDEGEPVRIIMVGRFEQQKNQPLLIRALARLRDLPWKLTFIGEGPQLQDGIQLAEQLGIRDRIHFAGYSNRVVDELQHHDLFALITRWEGFPRSILEAMAAGLPVLTSNVGGSAEAVVEGLTGHVVPPADEDYLVATLSKMITDRESLTRMGQAGRDRFVSQFTFDSMYHRYDRLYSFLINHPTALSKETESSDSTRSTGQAGTSRLGTESVASEIANRT
ncbi:MAG: glycosyltransferase family 4 protein [Verrucomicrobiota bacterium]